MSYGDVALLALVGTQVGSVGTIYDIGQRRLGNQHGGEVAHAVARGGEIDGKVLLRIVGMKGSYPHLHGSLQLKLGCNQPVVRCQDCRIIVVITG